MATVVTCPECDTNLKLAAEPTPGKKVKCPNCQAIFAPADAAARRVSVERPVAPAPRPRPARDEEEDDDLDREERRPRLPRPKQGKGNGLLIGLLVVGGALALLLVCGGVGGVVLYRALGEVGRNRNVQPPVAQQNGAANNKAAPPVLDPVPPPGGAGNNAAPAEPPMPGPAVPPQQPVNPPPPGPGGMPGNQPGDNQLPVVLSNARAANLGLKMDITVDYRWVQGGPRIGQHLFVIIKSARGKTYEARITSLRVGQEGTFELSGISFGGPDRGRSTSTWRRACPGRSASGRGCRTR